MELTSLDQQLIEAAIAHIKQHFSEKKHRLATSILTGNGEILTAVNVEGSFGCNDVCAEQVALGVALSQGKNDIACLVTAKHPRPEEANQDVRVVSPCGKCRELIIDYAPNAWVILRSGDDVLKVKATDLLPYRYSKV
ncbi:MAG: cytidine deaminase [bacterium]|nr:cytidine deaminase [bacterium]